MTDQCEKVITIPQFTGTCWFNSILMVCLYSHRMRQLLLNKIKLIDSKYKNDPLMKIFINIIESKYFEEINAPKDEIVSKLELKPEEIIDNLNKINKSMFYVTLNQNNNNIGYFPQFYINRFLTFFNINYNNIILIDYLNNTKKFCISQSFYKEKFNTMYLNFIDSNIIVKKRTDFIDDDSYNDYIQTFVNNFEDYKKKQEVYLKILYKELYEKYKNGNFDILIITYPLGGSFTLEDDFYYELDYFKINDQIQINNNTFILDSMILSNYNSNLCKKSHAIAGITCNDKRYIYNGWTSQTIDPTLNLKMTQKIKLFNTVPCSLIPYDWFNPNEDLSFCLNLEKCKLDFIKPDRQFSKKNMCFDIKKGENMHIFINKSCINPTFINN